MNIISKEIGIDAAHRVPLHQSKCKNIHGHRYLVIAEIQGNLCTSGPQTDMLLDYGFLKDLLMQYVDAYCDHGLILAIDDFKFVSMAYDEKLVSHASHIFKDWYEEIVAEVQNTGFWAGTTLFGKTYIMGGVPTAENLAKHWFSRLSQPVAEATNHRAFLSAVTVHETPSSIATYRQDHHTDWGV